MLARRNIERGWDGENEKVAGLLCNVIRSEQAKNTQIFIHGQMSERIRLKTTDKQ